MALRMEFMGTGTSQGVPVIKCSCEVCVSDDTRDQRLRSSVWMRTKDTDLLIDAGPDLRQQVLRSRINRLDGVLLTHEHMDHISGIDDLRAFNFAQHGPMDLYGTSATLDAVRRMYYYAFLENKYPGAPDLRLNAIGLEAFHVNSTRIVPVEVMHERMPVLGYRFADVAYITDAKTIGPDQRTRLRGLDVLVINALRIKPHHSHLNLEEAMALVSDLAPRRAYFTHISHLLGLHGQVSGCLPPGVHLAHDGLVVTSDE